ncbi:PAS sensor protein, partial [Streptomyces sp. BR123]|nr:PAS sensor protein [Streptomyces sp. BR123]
MNFTRWSARFPGTQRRAAARSEHAAAQAKRGEGAVPAARGAAGRSAAAPDGGPADDPAASGTGPEGKATGQSAGTGQGVGPVPAAPSLDELSVREVLGRLPALVALVHGPDHRVAYVNDAYTAGFGPRPAGA